MGGAGGWAPAGGGGTIPGAAPIGGGGVPGPGAPIGLGCCAGIGLGAFMLPPYWPCSAAMLPAAFQESHPMLSAERLTGHWL